MSTACIIHERRKAPQSEKSFRDHPDVITPLPDLLFLRNKLSEDEIKHNYINKSAADSRVSLFSATSISRPNFFLSTKHRLWRGSMKDHQLVFLNNSLWFIGHSNVLRTKTLFKFSDRNEYLEK